MQLPHLKRNRPNVMQIDRLTCMHFSFHEEALCKALEASLLPSFSVVRVHVSNQTGTYIKQGLLIFLS